MPIRGSWAIVEAASGARRTLAAVARSSRRGRGTAPRTSRDRRAQRLRRGRALLPCGGDGAAGQGHRRPEAGQHPKGRSGGMESSVVVDMHQLAAAHPKAAQSRTGPDERARGRPRTVPQMLRPGRSAPLPQGRSRRPARLVAPRLRISTISALAIQHQRRGDAIAYRTSSTIGATST